MTSKGPRGPPIGVQQTAGYNTHGAQGFMQQNPVLYQSGADLQTNNFMDSKMMPEINSQMGSQFPNYYQGMGYQGVASQS